MQNMDAVLRVLRALYDVFNMIVYVVRTACWLFAWILLLPILLMYLYDLSLYAVRLSTGKSSHPEDDIDQVPVDRTLNKPLNTDDGSAIVVTGVQIVTSDS
ncbi:uncharacterized protein Ecym_5491 [Eremothecium cymbalariae DBVPG|uniref:Uncharacterized protein n=1 Tax=Eremothecium cymbalariae (strain CBS 270.75 / DBVPG 7215 / KCTC 17166 / NRRL Y-17582) TaxID=931890 RepID=I6NDU4_ERECY|nr:hypothetical protein Ecym_5491 [Eremothecium cymbalariae DBVPG\